MLFSARRQRALLGIERERASRLAANPAVNRIGGYSDERCVPGETPGWCVAQHLARYVWALAACDGKAVVELGSGSGYGSYLLSWVASSVAGVEIDPAAVAHAQASYRGPDYVVGDITEPGSLPAGDLAVCFEVLEHVADPRAVLAGALDRYERLLLSFPNPLYAGSHLTPHHRVDWPLSKLKSELRRAGARKITASHQGMRTATVRRGAKPWHAIWILDVRR